MMRNDQSPVRLSALAATCSALLVLSAPALAQKEDKADASGDAGTLRVCAATEQAPFSTSDATGFENRIAEVLAAEMGRDLEYVWFDRPAIYIVRDQLDAKECDVVMGVDTGDERVLTSEPYYRTGYVFVSREETGFTGDSWDDPQIAEFSRFAMGFSSPAEVMLRQQGMSKYENNAAYLFSLVNFKSRRNQYVQVSPSRMVREVAQGKADLAIAFAPEVARYVTSSSVPLRMTVISDDQVRDDGVEIPHHFDQSVAVRKGDTELMEEIDEALASAAPQITAILEEEEIPLLSSPD